MMVDRRHAENALAGALVPEDLDDHRQRLDHEQPADEDEDEFVLRGHRDRRKRAAKREAARVRSEEHTSELQSLMRISYAVFCLKKKKRNAQTTTLSTQHKTRKHVQRT